MNIQRLKHSRDRGGATFLCALLAFAHVVEKEAPLPIAPYDHQLAVQAAWVAAVSATRPLRAKLEREGVIWAVDKSEQEVMGVKHPFVHRALAGLESNEHTVFEGATASATAVTAAAAAVWPPFRAGRPWVVEHAANKNDETIVPPMPLWMGPVSRRGALADVESRWRRMSDVLVGKDRDKRRVAAQRTSRLMHVLRAWQLHTAKVREAKAVAIRAVAKRMATSTVSRALRAWRVHVDERREAGVDKSSRLSGTPSKWSARIVEGALSTIPPVLGIVAATRNENDSSTSSSTSTRSTSTGRKVMVGAHTTSATSAIVDTAGAVAAVVSGVCTGSSAGAEGKSTAPRGKSTGVRRATRGRNPKRAARKANKTNPAWVGPADAKPSAAESAATIAWWAKHVTAGATAGKLDGNASAGACAGDEICRRMGAEAACEESPPAVPHCAAPTKRTTWSRVTQDSLGLTALSRQTSGAACSVAHPLKSKQVTKSTSKPCGGSRRVPLVSVNNVSYPSSSAGVVTKPAHACIQPLHHSSGGDPSLSTREPKPLMALDKITSLKKPAICGLRPWFGEIRVVGNDDGNCFGSSWMLSAVCWCVQRPDRLNTLIQRLDGVLLQAAEFRELPTDLQVYVRDFVKYIKSLRQEWANPPDGESAIDNHGSFIALTVVNKFMGPKGQGYRTSSESSCEEEEWLALYKGLVLSARILDVVSAPADLGKEDMTKMRTLCESVAMDATTMRPGRGAALVMDLATEFAKGDKSGRSLDEYMPYYMAESEGKCALPVVSGFGLRVGAVPHFDFVLSTGTRLSSLVVQAYDVDLSRDDDRDVAILVRNAESQRVTPLAEVHAAVEAADGEEMVLMQAEEAAESVEDTPAMWQDSSATEQDALWERAKARREAEMEDAAFAARLAREEDSAARAARKAAEEEDAAFAARLAAELEAGEEGGCPVPPRSGPVDGGARGHSGGRKGRKKSRRRR